MLGTIYLLMQHNKPEYLNHQQHHCKNLIFHRCVSSKPNHLWNG